MIVSSLAGKNLQDVKIVLISDGNGQAKLTSIQAYTDNDMNELCQSQESNGDVVQEKVWIQYSVNSPIRKILVKTYNVKTILSNPSAQVGSYIRKDSSHCHMYYEQILNPLYTGNPETCTLTNS